MQELSSIYNQGEAIYLISSIMVELLEEGTGP